MGSRETLRLPSAALPLLPGALRLALEEYSTGGCKRNRIYLADKVRVLPEVPRGLNEVAFDPQTSGGLLIAVPAYEAEALVCDLLNEGAPVAALIGEAVPHAEAWVGLK